MKVIVILFVAVALFSAFAECRINIDKKNSDNDDDDIDGIEWDFTPWLGPFSLSPSLPHPPPTPPPPPQDSEM